LIDSRMAPFFDFQPDLSNGQLRLRPLGADDLEDLYRAANSPQTWAGHPSKDRYRQEIFEPYARTLLESGGSLVVIDAAEDRIIGCSRFYVSPDQPESISIGFTFLHHSRWGGSTNFELKRLMLGHAFRTFSEVWFHVSPVNIRSQKATRKLGAEYVRNAVLDLSGQPTAWMCFRLWKDAWDQTCRNRRERGESSFGSNPC
jgi:N-acetyltransferase